MSGFSGVVCSGHKTACKEWNIVGVVGVKRYTGYHYISWYSRQDTYRDTEKLIKIRIVSVYYPTLGCDIQGFRAMWLSVQYWPRWFQDFRRSDWLYHSEQMGPIWGSVPCQKKNLFCVWNKLFLGEIKFSQRRTHPVKSLWWQIVPMQESTNGWKNITIFGLVVHNGKTSNSEVPIDKINIEILEIFQNFRNITRFNLKLFYEIQMYSNSKVFLDQYTRVV